MTTLNARWLFKWSLGARARWSSMFFHYIQLHITFPDFLTEYSRQWHFSSFHRIQTLTAKQFTVSQRVLPPSSSSVSKHALSFSHSVLGAGLKGLYTTIKGIFLLFRLRPLGIRNKSSQTPELSSNLRKHHPDLRLGTSAVRFISEDELTT